MTNRSSRIRCRIAVVIGAAAAFCAVAPAAHAADRVYWANFGGDKLSSASLDGSGGADLDTGATTVSAPTGTAIDPATGRIYWADSGSAIKFANLDGSGGGGTLDTTGATINQIRGMVLDHAAGKIYWANESGNKISFANLNGSGGGDIDTTGATVTTPDGVAIDKAAGKIYWANLGDNAHPISSANLDGSGGGADLDTTGATASNASGPTIDTGAGKIYWANKGNDTISFANLTGAGGGQLATTGATLSGPFGTALDTAAGKIYSASFDGTTIPRVNLDGSGGSDLSTTGATVSNPLYSSLLEAPAGAGAPQVAGTAQVGHPLSCSQGDWAPDKVAELLYRAPQSFSYEWLRDGTPIGGAASATYDFTAADSGHTITCRVTAHNFAGQAQQTSDPARGPSERIFWANSAGDSISFADLDGSGNGGQLATPGVTGHGPDGLAIDSAAGRLYVAYSSGVAIGFTSLDGSGGGGDLDVSGSGANVPAGLVVDHAAGKVYWGNYNAPSNSALSYANLDGSGGAPISTFPATSANPSGLAIDTATNRLYWSNFSDNTHAISFANPGGGGQNVTVLGNTFGVYALAIDKTAGRMYWANEAANSIWSADLDGSNAHFIDTTGATVASPTGIAIDHAAGKVYWTNLGTATHAISYANIDGSGANDLDTTGANPSGASYPNLLRKPSSTAAPVISGLAGAGSNLSCSHGGWKPDDLGAFLYQTPESYGYQWLKDNAPISGQTNPTYAVTPGDVGHQIECRVTARNLGGNTDATSAPTTIKIKPANTARPSISGTPVAGHLLTCHKGTWSGSMPQTYAYRWLRGSAPISGATNATYVVKAADTGKQLKCRVTASNAAGSAMGTSAAVTIKTPPKNTVAPKITGTPKVGKTLTCAKGTWTGSAPITYKYQWLRNGAPIAGATKATYVAKTADQSKSVSCKVTATNAAGSATKTTAGVKVT